MKINWKVRFANPEFWKSIILAVFVPLLAYYGMNWADMTTWATIGELFVQAVQNPVVVLSLPATCEQSALQLLEKAPAPSSRDAGADSWKSACWASQ